jgi:hypothetical protein
MPNTNCLENIACPKCGSDGPFFIEVRKQVLMHDDGSEECDSDEHWDSESYCRCFECDHEGEVTDFTKDFQDYCNGEN